MTPSLPTGREAIARLFHDTYERLAPSFGYETRTDTRAFDPTTPNGKLMMAVCGEVAEALSPARISEEADFPPGAFVRRLIDLTWGHAIGDESVPSTKTSLQLVEKAAQQTDTPLNRLADRLSAPPLPQGAEGWVSVPKEPTEAMREAGTLRDLTPGQPNYGSLFIAHDEAEEVYLAMLAAVEHPK